MNSVIATAGRHLAARPSRRGFLRMLGGAALGIGLALNGSSLALAGGCCGCGGCSGGNCHLCYGQCSGGCGSTGCRSGCTNTGTWTCCVFGCTVYCAECNCPEGCCSCGVVTSIICAGAGCNRPAALRSDARPTLIAVGP